MAEHVGSLLWVLTSDVTDAPPDPLGWVWHSSGRLARQLLRQLFICPVVLKLPLPLTKSVSLTKVLSGSSEPSFWLLCLIPGSGFGLEGPVLARVLLKQHRKNPPPWILNQVPLSNFLSSDPWLLPINCQLPLLYLELSSFCTEILLLYCSSLNKICLVVLTSVHWSFLLTPVFMSVFCFLKFKKNHEKQKCFVILKFKHIECCITNLLLSKESKHFIFVISWIHFFCEKLKWWHIS